MNTNKQHALYQRNASRMKYQYLQYDYSKHAEAVVKGRKDASHKLLLLHWCAPYVVEYLKCHIKQYLMHHLSVYLVWMRQFKG